MGNTGNQNGQAVQQHPAQPPNSDTMVCADKEQLLNWEYWCGRNFWGWKRKRLKKKILWWEGFCIMLILGLSRDVFSTCMFYVGPMTSLWYSKGKKRTRGNFRDGGENILIIYFIFYFLKRNCNQCFGMDDICLFPLYFFTCLSSFCRQFIIAKLKYLQILSLIL